MIIFIVSGNFATLNYHTRLADIDITVTIVAYWWRKINSYGRLSAIFFKKIALMELVFEAWINFQRRSISKKI